jgi:methylated-DNA-protein-cysteine methyltransferase-like protein
MPTFTSPPDAVIFNNQVWEIVRRVPPGRVISYGEIARLIPVPDGLEPRSYQVFGPRWVGSAMAKCPDDVPWQRVVNAKGEISLRPGAEHQRRLLEDEGIVFNSRGRIDLKTFGWQGPGVDPEQPGLL